MPRDALARYDTVRAVAWQQGRLRLLDQRRLPDEVVYLEPADAAETAAAIADMAVRGAPAIALAAAYGLVLEAQRLAGSERRAWQAGLDRAAEMLAAARPTAVHVQWTLRHMAAAARRAPGDAEALRAEAERLHAEDVAGNYRMGELGAAEIAPGSAVLTHCNTGSLASGGFGTALGVVRAGYASGRVHRVYVGETRPWRQGARLTVWELLREAIPVHAIVDSAAAHFMARGAIDWLVVGADRIAANGDVANKIGTYSLAVAARYHGVGVMVVAPAATVDFELASGAEIPIEQRDGREVLGEWAVQPGAEGLLTVPNPVFDVTPAGLIDVLVTERGAVHGPDTAGVARLRDTAVA